MKAFKHILAALVIIAVPIFILRFSGEENLSIPVIIGIIFIVFFGLNIVIRNFIWFKPYFISPINFLTTKYRSSSEIDMSLDLMFDKLLEVLKESNLKVQYANSNDAEIFVTTSVTWKSWGENMYINMAEKNGKTTIDFVSATLFQSYSWGKNEQNFEKLLKSIEESLII